VARAAQLPFVGSGGELERPRQQLPVGVGLVGLYLGDQLIDEVVMRFEYRHTLSVPLASPVFIRARGRKAALAAERFSAMLRRRRQAKKLRAIARLLCEVESAGAGRRPARRVERVAVGRT
jgi:hypothetical protein